MKTLVVFALALFAFTCGSALAVQNEIFGLQQGSNGNFHILRYDVGANSFYDCGVLATGTTLTTNLAMDANRRLYYMHPFQGGHDIWQADLDGSNNLINQVLHDTLTQQLSIIDGFTIGPNQDLYMTGYGHSEIYRYVTGSNSGTVTTEVTLSGGGAGRDGSEYRSDLAFDPITGYLVGIGIVPGVGGHRGAARSSKFPATWRRTVSTTTTPGSFLAATPHPGPVPRSTSEALPTPRGPWDPIPTAWPSIRQPATSISPATAKSFRRGTATTPR